MVTQEKNLWDNLDISEDLVHSFNNLNPTEYYGLVTDAVNPNNLEAISRQLELIDLPDGVLVSVAGSDGKLEQHAQSKTELIVIQEESSLNGDVILQDFFGSEHYLELFDTGPCGVIDTKSLDQNVPLSYAFGDANTAYPDRTLNMFPLHPLTESGLDLYLRTRERTLEEMSRDKSIKGKLKDQLRSYKRSMKTGEFRHIPIFDYSRHVQYYSEMWPAYSTGFKTAFLRAVQRKLDLLTINLGSTKDWNEVAREMPTTTLGRLEYLAEANVITRNSAVLTAEAYAWFLQQYHYIQEVYKINQEPTELPFDPVLFERYSQSIEHFSNF